MAAMDIFEAIEKHGVEPGARRCPACGGDDVKFATHDARAVTYSHSARCADCGHSDTSTDPEQLVLRWKAIPA